MSPSTQEHRGALEAIDRILNRGGDADDVLRDVLAVLARLFPYAAIDFVENGALVPGPSAGEAAHDPDRFGVDFQSMHVAELRISGASDEDRAFLERVALLISPYCLVGWDTGGVSWPTA